MADQNDSAQTQTNASERIEPILAHLKAEGTNISTSFGNSSKPTNRARKNNTSPRLDCLSTPPIMCWMTTT